MWYWKKNIFPPWNSYSVFHWRVLHTISTKNKHRTSRILSAFHHHFPVFFPAKSSTQGTFIKTGDPMDAHSIHHLWGEFRGICWEILVGSDVTNWHVEMLHFMIRSILHGTHLQLFQCIFVLAVHVFHFSFFWKKDGNRTCNFITMWNLPSYIHVPTHRTSHPLTHLWIKDKLWTCRLYSIFTNHRTKRLRCVLAKLRFWLGIHIAHVVYGRDNILPVRIIGQM